MLSSEARKLYVTMDEVNRMTSMDNFNHQLLSYFSLLNIRRPVSVNSIISYTITMKSYQAINSVKMGLASVTLFIIT
jgi:hypothetical protein